MKFSVLVSLTLLVTACASFPSSPERNGSENPSRESAPQSVAEVLRNQRPGETAEQRVAQLSCAELPSATYAFQAHGGGPENPAVGDAVQAKLVSCEKYAELFAARPWPFEPKVCIDAARTPRGEKALRALLARKDRDELAAVSKWIEGLLRDDRGPDFSPELADAYDVFPTNAVFLYLVGKRHPKAPTIAATLLSSPDWKTRLVACRAVADLNSAELKRRAESVASNDEYREWGESPSGSRIVRSYPVREMCKMSLQMTKQRP